VRSNDWFVDFWTEFIGPVNYAVYVYIRFTANSPNCRFAAGKYGASWYPVLPAKLLAFYWTLSLRCFDLVSVGRVGCLHHNLPHLGVGQVDSGAK